MKAIAVYAYGSPPGGARAALYARDGVVAREVVETVPNGALHITFNDDTDLRLGSDSTVTLDKFVYEADSSGGELALSMGRGVFRFVSGRVNKEGVRLTTPTSVIGVRGTDFTVAVAADGSTQVSVSEGIVDITAINGGTQVSVSAGEGATIDASGASVQISKAASAPDDPGLQEQDEAGDGDGGGGSE